MRTKKGGDFSRMVRTVTSRMPRMSIFPRMSRRSSRVMPIFPRMSTRSRRVIPTPMIPEESASNQATSDTAKSIEQLKKTLKSIEEEIIEKEQEYKRNNEEAKRARQRGNNKAVRQHLFTANNYKNIVKSLKIKKSNTEALLDTLVSLTATAEKVQKLKSRVASQTSITPESKEGGKIMRKSKRIIRRIRKTRRHKI
jgi:hypothetical protein